MPETKNNEDRENTTPVIGILGQQWNKDEETYLCYVAASYVKYLECAGARVVPILLEQSENYYEKIFENINGLLLPGGGACLKTSNWAKTATKFMIWSKKEADLGGYFPIWGTCLGFEQMFVSMHDFSLQLKSSDESYPIMPCNGCRAITTKIIPHSGWESSKMINSLSNDIAKSIAAGEPCSYSWHKKCISLNVQRFSQFSRMKIIAKSHEANDLFLKDFVAMAENEELGWFGTIFHPEKAQFEFGREEICHTDLAIRFGFELARFFVNETKKNQHTFAQKPLLIYNFQPTFVDMKDWQQVYLFPRNK